MIAKLEKPEAVEPGAIGVVAFDAIMVARGDLGVELPPEEVPLVQKRAIQIARENAKPVIVATQMLESMIGRTPARPGRGLRRRQRRPGRNRRGDAVGETSVGKYPIEAVQTMARIIRCARSRRLE